MCPVGRRFDFMLGGKGYMLARGQYTGRAWRRTGASDSPGRRSATDVKYGELPDELDHPEVWDDWSGGYGQAYRRAGENTYHWAENFDARFPRQLVHCQEPLLASATATNPNDLTIGLEECDALLDSGLLSANGKTITLFGHSKINAITPVNNKTIQVVGGPLISGDSRNLHPAAIWGSYAYVGDSGGTAYSWATDKGLVGLVPLPGFRLAIAGNRLWRAHGPSRENAYYLQSIADTALSAQASTSNWSATINVGNANAPIVDLIALDDQVFAGTRNGLYAGDQTGTFVNVLGEMAKQPHEDNCRDLCIYEGAVIAPYGGGLYAYHPNSFAAYIENIGPPQADLSPVKGRIRTASGYGPWLYSSRYTGSQAWLLAAQRVGERYIWHTLQRFPHSVKPGRLLVDGITSASGGTPILPNRIWMAADASIDTGGTAPVYWWPVPPFDANPLSNAPNWSANYCGSARIDFGAVDWGSPGTPKVYRAVEVWADNLASGAQWANVYYTVDSEATRHLLGTTAKSPKDTLYFSSGEGSFVTGQSIALSLESFTASAGVTPVYRAVVLRGALRPQSVDQITAVARIADNITDRQGSPLNRSGATMLAELRGFAAAGSPTSLEDLAGATQYVSVLPPVEESENRQEGTTDPEIAATVKMAVLTFS